MEQTVAKLRSVTVKSNHTKQRLGLLSKKVIIWIHGSKPHLFHSWLQTVWKAALKKQEWRLCAPSHFSSWRPRPTSQTCNYTCKKMWVKYFLKIGWKTDWSKADRLISVVTSAACLKGLHCAAASRGNPVVSAQGWLEDTGGVLFNLRQPCFSHPNASSGGYWLFDTQVVVFGCTAQKWFTH